MRVLNGFLASHSEIAVAIVALAAFVVAAAITLIS
jgi:hypothetical protein